MMSSSPFTVQKRVLAASGLALGVAMMVTSCSVANSGSSDGNSADKVRIVLAQEPPTLEPCDASLTATGSVVRSNITEPLVERNPESGQIDPLLATKWEATGDTEWTFTLREGVKFQDGTAFNAKAAKFAIERVLESSVDCNVKGYVFGDEKLTVDAKDDSTLVISTSVADPILPLRISFIEMVPSTTSTTEKVHDPIGTGPYQVEKWDAGTKLTFSRFDDYWGDAPTFKTAEYQWRAEGTIRAAMITSGEADIAMGLGPDDGAGDLAVSFPNNETTAIRMTGTIEPFTDIRVRQAVAHAIDQEGIIKSLHKGAGFEPATQLVRSGIVGHNDDLKLVGFDVNKAKQLIAEAKADGVAVDNKITLVARNAQFPKVSEEAEVIQKELTDIGLNVELKMVDTTEHLEYQLTPFVTDQGAIALLIQHGNQAGDAQFTVDQYMSTTGAQSVYGTPELDAMLKAAALKSGDERQDAYAEIFAYQNEKVVQFAYLAHQTGELGKSARVAYKPNAATGDELHIADITLAK